MPKKTKENEIIKSKNTSTISNKKTSKKSTNKIESSKKVSTKKVSTKKVSTKKATSTKKTSKTDNSNLSSMLLPEYYDLPNKYNKTIVKILAQTPKTLFIYWEISDKDIEDYKKRYGENFFETTKPVLIVHNTTLNYSFEVEINDFANSWYLHINDSLSTYAVELGRRPIKINDKIDNNYICISSSNEIEAPNDHILFNNSQKMVYFRNVKTNKETSKSISSLSFMQNMGKIYDIYDIYKDVYDQTNPTSSQFK